MDFQPNHSAKINRQTAAAKNVLAHLASLNPMDIGITLWDGSVQSLNPENPSPPTVGFAITTPDAITRLTHRPSFDTLVKCLAAGEIEIVGGTLLDIAAKQGGQSRKGLIKKLNKTLLLKNLAPFFFASAGKTTRQDFTGAIQNQHEAGRDDKALVQFHYDLSNEFYALFLDPEMQYSCAYYPRWDASLEEAQRAKLDMICKKLRLKEGERFLDIGCGWGGLVCHAAQHYGVKAHGVTLSAAQLAFTKAKIARLGLEEKITVELRDFRDLSGAFDKIASIGMFEHVGIDNHAAYFRHIHGLLRPRGLLLNHAIARPAKRKDKNFRRQSAHYRALTTYIFPGGELDHIGMSLANLERYGFEVHDVEGWREHYARTTKLWCERLYAAREEAEHHVGAAKLRIWLIYLAGCALAFERGSVGIFQTLASKKTKGSAGLPPTRGDWY